MSEVDKIMDYLGASRSNRNIGTRVKMTILENVILICLDKKDITIDKLVSILSLSCNVTPRTMREGYVEPLIDVGILRKSGNVVSYIGITEIKPEKKKLTKEEQEKLEKEAMK